MRSQRQAGISTWRLPQDMFGVSILSCHRENAPGPCCLLSKRLSPPNFAPRYVAVVCADTVVLDRSSNLQTRPTPLPTTNYEDLEMARKEPRARTRQMTRGQRRKSSRKLTFCCRFPPSTGRSRMAVVRRRIEAPGAVSLCVANIAPSHWFAPSSK